jgi:hypothetical protein
LYTNSDIHQDVAYYFNRAYHLRKSPKSFHLPAAGNYSYLREFTNLTALMIEIVHNIKNMFDCDRSIRYLPHLESLEVYLTNTTSTGIQQEDVYEDVCGQDFIADSYSNLRGLKLLVQFVPQYEEQL